MKYFILINLLVLATGINSQVPAVKPSVTPVNTNLAQDLLDLQRIVPLKALNQLVVRYLLNDAEFQAVIRAINSIEAFVIRLTLLSQPEVVQLRNFINQNLLLSGVSVELDESIELSIFNKSPYWAQSVNGWQGFVDEFSWIYPADLIRAQIDAKVSQQGALAAVWLRLKAVEAAYDRILSRPQAQNVIAKLESLGVNTAAVDQFIRVQLGWRNATVSDTLTLAAPNKPTILARSPFFYKK